MNLGQEAWDKSKWYYDELSLSGDGDNTERYAWTRYPLFELLPNYERFWRYHIAPASQRPGSVFTRPDADQIESLIGQRSHSVCCKILEALDQLVIIENQGFGARLRNAKITLDFAGDALIMFSELERVIAGPANAFTKSIGCLADRIRVKITPPSRIAIPTCAQLRDEIVIYRHYLTHNGEIFTVQSKDTGETFVLRRKCLVGKDPVSWAQAETQHMSIRENWQELKSACVQVVKDTIALLDLGYEALSDEMDKLLTGARYQGLWGWSNGMAEIPNPPPPTAEGSSQSRIRDVFGDHIPSDDILFAQEQLRSTHGDPL